ncbi:DUF4250 domain-containing protein [Fusibacter bizertensis]
MAFNLPQDPAIMLSMINMKLRDFYPDLTSLCDDLDFDIDYVMHTLNTAGYIYNLQTNQFHQA